MKYNVRTAISISNLCLCRENGPAVQSPRTYSLKHVFYMEEEYSFISDFDTLHKLNY